MTSDNKVGGRVRRRLGNVLSRTDHVLVSFDGIIAEVQAAVDEQAFATQAIDYLRRADKALPRRHDRV